MSRLAATVVFTEQLRHDLEDAAETLNRISDWIPESTRLRKQADVVAYLRRLVEASLGDPPLPMRCARCGNYTVEYVRAEFTGRGFHPDTCTCGGAA